MEVSLDRNDFVEMSNLQFVTEESFRQMFIYFDRSPNTYLTMLNGCASLDKQGLPIHMYFGHIQPVVNNWSKFTDLFRLTAMDLYGSVLSFANSISYQNHTFTYLGYPNGGGGLSFALTEPDIHYDL